jgi:mRNA interferase RelE/StbE
MSYTVEVVRPAEKFLRGSTDKKLYQRLRETIEALKENPRPVDSIKLQGEADLYRVRVGDYRIVYQIQDKKPVVLVVQVDHRRVGHRWEIYR